MMRAYTLAAALLLLVAATVVAQPLPMFDSDDDVDPRQHHDTVFISRLVLGGGTSLTDDYRPLRNGGGFFLFANSLYWKQFQFDYKHSKIFNDDDKIELQRCGCQPPIYFPTPPSAGSTPLAPPQSAKDTLQFAFYYGVPGRATEPRVMLRARLTGSRQSIDTVTRSFLTQEVVEQRSGREQSFGINADTYFRVGRHNVWGEVFYARTAQSGATPN